MGVKIAAGTDMGLGPDLLGKEIGLMVKFGMNPGEAIKAGTKDAASCMGMDDIVNIFAN